MERHIWTTFFLLFSFSILLFGGYNCAQRTVYPPSGLPPQGGVPTFAPGTEASSVTSLTSEVVEEDSNLPSRPEGGCNRSQYRNLEKTYGASAYIHLNKVQLREFLLGRDTNFDLGCPRLFLNMEKYGRKRFEGSLTIAYEDSGRSGRREIKVEKHITGSSDADMKYNDWKGSWNKAAGRGGIIEPRFVAIFSRTPYRAVILHINKVKKHELGDGEVRHLGSGDIWFKSFRAYSGRRNDVCYRQGSYVIDSALNLQTPSTSCWNVRVGPFSCLPDGINTLAKVAERLNPKSRELKLPCYKKFGEFGNLDISEAFNISSEDRIDSL